MATIHPYLIQRAHGCFSSISMERSTSTARRHSGATFTAIGAGTRRALAINSIGSHCPLLGQGNVPAPG